MINDCLTWQYIDDLQILATQIMKELQQFHFCSLHQWRSSKDVDPKCFDDDKWVQSGTFLVFKPQKCNCSLAWLHCNWVQLYHANLCLVNLHRLAPGVMHVHGGYFGGKSCMKEDVGMQFYRIYGHYLGHIILSAQLLLGGGIHGVSSCGLVSCKYVINVIL